MESVEQIRWRNRQEFEQQGAKEHVTPRGERGTLVHADSLDYAQLIAEQNGEITEELGKYCDEQITAHLLESMGAWNSQIDVPFDGKELLVFGESYHVSSVRSVLAAFAIQQADPSYDFYPRRNLAEYWNNRAQTIMMREKPVGSAQVLISPAEMEKIMQAKKLGMQPGRSMAILQIAWKSAEDVMTLRSVSLDRATLDVVSEHLQKMGITVPVGAKAEDFISLVKELHFDSQEQLDAFVEVIVDRHDRMMSELYGLQTKQGVTATDARNLQLSSEDILGTGAGRLLIKQRLKVDKAIAGHILEPKPLGIGMRHLVQRSVHQRRADGRPLLSASDQEQLRRLLVTGSVDINNPAHRAALEKVIYIHNSAVEESYRKFRAGSKSALDWMLSKELGFADSIEAVNAGTEAIEAGRGSEACGLGADISSDGHPPDASLQEKYGWEDLFFGECIGCGTEDLLGPCSACNGCDAADRRTPGTLYIMVKMRAEKLEQQARKEQKTKAAKRKLGKKSLFALSA